MCVGGGGGGGGVGWSQCIGVRKCVRFAGLYNVLIQYVLDTVLLILEKSKL